MTIDGVGQRRWTIVDPRPQHIERLMERLRARMAQRGHRQPVAPRTRQYTAAMTVTPPTRRAFWVGIACAITVLAIWTSFILIARFSAQRLN